MADQVSDEVGEPTLEGEAYEESSAGEETAQGKLRIDPELAPRDGMIAAMSGILAHARQQIDLVEEEPVEAVHGYRKSLRRARTLLKLARPILNKRKEYRKMRDALRTAFQQTNGLRDADVLLATLKLVPLDDLDVEGLERLKGQLAQRLEEQQSISAQEILEGQQKTLEKVEASFAKKMPKKLKRSSFRRGLRKTYERCREARMASAMGRADEHLHEWRKRSKEVRYQLEAIAGGLDEHPAQSLRAEFAQLAQQLGKLTDLLVLEAKLAGDFSAREDVDEGLVEAVLERSKRERERLFNAAFVDSVSLFAMEPREFAKVMVF